MKKSNEKQKKSNGKMIAIYAVMALLLLVAGFGVTYAYLNWTGTGATTTIKPATFECGFTDTGVGADTTGANGTAMVIGNTENPLSEAEGLAKEPYKFTVSNTGTTSINYTVLMVKEAATLDPSKLTLSLRKTTDAAANDVAKKALSAYTAGTSIIANSYILDSGTLAASATQDYFMRSWLNSSTVNADSGKNWSGHLYIYCEQTTK